jgi:hypothetical protein
VKQDEQAAVMDADFAHRSGDTMRVLDSAEFKEQADRRVEKPPVDLAVTAGSIAV